MQNTTKGTVEMQQILESLNRLQHSIAQEGFTSELEFYVEPQLFIALHHHSQQSSARFVATDMPTEVTVGKELAMIFPHGNIKIKTHKVWDTVSDKMTATFIAPELIRERWAEEKYDIHKDLENL